MLGRRYLPKLFFLIAALTAAAAWAYWDARNQEREAVRDIKNLANALSEHVRGTLKKADQLANVIQVENKIGHAANLIDALRETRVIGSDAFQQVSITDKFGNIIKSSNPKVQAVNISDSDYFLVNKNGDARRLFISKPAVDRASGLRSIKLTKRLVSSAGEFDGVVVISVDPDYFINVYKALEIGDKGVISIIGLEDYVVRVRRSRLSSESGQVVPRSLAFNAELSKSTIGNFRSISPIDNIARHFAYAVVDGYPVFVLVGLDDDEMLAAIKRRSIVFFATAMALAFVYIAFEIARLRSMSQLKLVAEAERQARQLQETQTIRMQQLFQTLPDGILVVESTGKIIRANESAHRLLEKPQNSLVRTYARNLAMQLLSDDPESSFMKEDELRKKINTIRSGLPCNVEIPTNSSSMRRVLQFRSLPFFGFDGYFIIIRDITAERHLDKMKSEFVATAAHQLRTPLASLRGFSELLVFDKVPDAARHKVYQVIHNQATHMSAVLSDLLDLARIEAWANQTFDRKDCSIEYLISKAKEYNPAIAGRIDVFCGDTGATVHGDENLLIQALYNLLDNAAKYSPRDTRVIVKTRMDVQKMCVNIDVSDVGIGMTSEQCAQAFKRFFRAHSDSSVPGTGLGLSLVKEIAEMHSGRVSITSEVNRGTCATLCLPIRPPSRPPVGGDANPRFSGGAM